MRLKIILEAATPPSIPINYQEFLSAAVYRMLDTSDSEYARFLHDDGYALDDGPKRFKLFTFGWLRGRRIGGAGDTVTFAPGRLEWQIASPVEDFVRHLATGLLASGSVQIGRVSLPVAVAEVLPPPALAETTRFVCLSPIVAGVPDPRGTRYLRATDGQDFSEAVRKNLIRKHKVLFGAPPADDRLELRFDPEYIARASQAGAKKITVHGIDVIGVLAPFTLSGSTELMRVGMECGLGEKNASGFGMVEVRS